MKNLSAAGKERFSTCRYPVIMIVVSIVLFSFLRNSNSPKTTVSPSEENRSADVRSDSSAPPIKPQAKEIPPEIIINEPLVEVSFPVKKKIKSYIKDGKEVFVEVFYKYIDPSDWSFIESQEKPFRLDLHDLIKDPNSSSVSLLHRFDNMKSSSLLVELSLGGADITNTDLVYLNGLVQLKKLDLYTPIGSPKITNEGLAHLKVLPYLKEVVLPKNISDAGLAHLKGLTQLQLLDLYRTKITDAGLVHLKGLTQLQTLYLGNTDITDAGLVHLKELTQLQTLSLYNIENITDAGLALLEGLTQLKKLDLTRIKCTHYFTTSVIERLEKALPNCEIDATRHFGEILLDTEEDWSKVHSQKEPYRFRFSPTSSPSNSDVAQFSTLKSPHLLRELIMDGNAYSISNEGLAHLKGLTQLETLWLPYVSKAENITDAGLVHLQGLTQLQELSLGYTNITDTGLVYLKELPNLRKLNLGLNKITDAGLVHLKEFPKLKELSSKSSNAGLVHLKRLTSLQSLDLSSGNITDAGLVHLKEMTQLKKLMLRDWGLRDGETLSDAGLIHLEGLTQLNDLQLSGKKFTDAGLVHLKKMTQLKNLNISDTSITEMGKSQLKEALPDCNFTSSMTF